MLPAGKPFPIPANRQQDIPLLRFGVHRVPQRVVGVVLEGHAGRGVPLGVFLAKALLGIGSQPQLLPLPQLHNQDVCKSTFEKAERRYGCVGSHCSKGRVLVPRKMSPGFAWIFREAQLCPQSS